jgi:hypothetical protein
MFEIAVFAMMWLAAKSSLASAAQSRLTLFGELGKITAAQDSILTKPITHTGRST